VAAVTAGCCWLATRWAVRQFQTESVLFREGERVGLRLWLQHVVRDRGERPSVAEALLCGLIILLATFFAGLRPFRLETWNDFVRMVTATQLGLVAGPALIMTIVLARSPRQTLLLNTPRAWTVPVALLLAVALHPLALMLARGIEATYPLNEDMLRRLEGLTQVAQRAELWQLLLVMALTPAICEELAFRGFILSGLRHLGSSWSAVVISSLLFGLTHGLLQQSLSAIAVGIVIGYVALQTNSLLPGAVFHFTYNSLTLLSGRVAQQGLEQYPWLDWILYPTTDSQVAPYAYRLPILIVSGIVSLGLIWTLKQFSRQSPRASQPRSAVNSFSDR
jgi:sodium transport system permease protein